MLPTFNKPASQQIRKIASRRALKPYTQATRPHPPSIKVKHLENPQLVLTEPFHYDLLKSYDHSSFS